MPSNPLQAIARQPACYRLLMKRRALTTRTERALRWVSKDRIGVLDLVGLPSIQVTVPGRKTGIPRTTSLQYVPDGDALLVVGSNWGTGKHPAWSANFMAAQQVTVRRRDEQFTASVGKALVVCRYVRHTCQLRSPCRHSPEAAPADSVASAWGEVEEVRILPRAHLAF